MSQHPATGPSASLAEADDSAAPRPDRGDNDGVIHRKDRRSWGKLLGSPPSVAPRAQWATPAPDPESTRPDSPASPAEPATRTPEEPATTQADEAVETTDGRGESQDPIEALRRVWGDLPAGDEDEPQTPWRERLARLRAERESHRGTRRAPRRSARRSAQEEAAPEPGHHEGRTKEATRALRELARSEQPADQPTDQPTGPPADPRELEDRVRQLTAQLETERAAREAAEESARFAAEEREAARQVTDEATRERRAALDELAAARDATPVPEPVPEPEPEPQPQPQPQSEPPPGPQDEPGDDVPDRVELRPRRAGRLLVLVIEVLLLVATVLAAVEAYRSQTTTAIGFAVALGVLLVVVHAIRSSSSATRITVDRGVLDIVHDGSHHRFDLGDSDLGVEEVGTPGRRGWRFLVHRRGMTPYRIDGSMVDPHEFMRVVRQHRPGL